MKKILAKKTAGLLTSFASLVVTTTLSWFWANNPEVPNELLKK